MKKSAGRPKIPDGKSRHIIATEKEFEEIKDLLKSIRNKQQ